MRWPSIADMQKHAQHKKRRTKSSRKSTRLISCSASDISKWTTHPSIWRFDNTLLLLLLSVCGFLVVAFVSSHCAFSITVFHPVMATHRHICGDKAVCMDTSGCHEMPLKHMTSVGTILKNDAIEQMELPCGEQIKLSLCALKMRRCIYSLCNYLLSIKICEKSIIPLLTSKVMPSTRKVYKRS